MLALYKYFLKIQSRCKLHDWCLEASDSWDTLQLELRFGQLERQGLLMAPYSGLCRISAVTCPSWPGRPVLKAIKAIATPSTSQPQGGGGGLLEF